MNWLKRYITNHCGTTDIFKNNVPLTKLFRRQLLVTAVIVSLVVVVALFPAHLLSATV